MADNILTKIAMLLVSNIPASLQRNSILDTHNLGERLPPLHYNILVQKGQTPGNSKTVSPCQYVAMSMEFHHRLSLYLPSYRMQKELAINKVFFGTSPKAKLILR